MDGGNAWQKFIKVTLPFIMPSVVINMLLNVISGLKVFDVIYTLTNGGPGKMSEVVEIVILNEFAIGNYGYGTAYSIIIMLDDEEELLPVYSTTSPSDTPERIST